MRLALILRIRARALAGTGMIMAAQTLGTRPVMIEVGATKRSFWDSFEYGEVNEGESFGGKGKKRGDWVSLYAEGKLRKIRAVGLP
jgi:hypothetical protein